MLLNTSRDNIWIQRVVVDIIMTSSDSQSLLFWALGIAQQIMLGRVAPLVLVLACFHSRRQEESGWQNGKLMRGNHQCASLSTWTIAKAAQGIPLQGRMRDGGLTQGSSWLSHQMIGYHKWITLLTASQRGGWRESQIITYHYVKWFKLKNTMVLYPQDFWNFCGKKNRRRVKHGTFRRDDKMDGLMLDVGLVLKSC